MIPRANNAIFLEIEGSEKLDYINSIPDPNRPDDEYGHIQAHSGDSGGPLWRECENGKAQLIAIWRSNWPGQSNYLCGKKYDGVINTHGGGPSDDRDPTLESQGAAGPCSQG